MTGEDAKTVHRLLDFDPVTAQFNKNFKNKLEGAKVVLVDEVSMMDLALLNGLVEAIPPSAVLILVGDEDQLPSVGSGAVLADIIKSKALETVRLNQVHRQRQASNIVKVAHTINIGKVPALSSFSFPPPIEEMMANLQADNNDSQLSDFCFIEAERPSDVVKTITNLVSGRLCDGSHGFAFNPLDIQVLTPMAPGEIGSRNLNALLQEQINPPHPSKFQVEGRGYIFREGDKIMQLVNNYDKDVYNGESGFIRSIRLVPSNSPSESDDTESPSRVGGRKGFRQSHSRTARSLKSQEMIRSLGNKLPLSIPGFEIQIGVEFDRHSNEKLIVYGPKELDQIVPSYCITVHKSQGNEFPVIIMPIHMDHRYMLQRKIIYTAITRGKQLVILVGQHRAASYAVGRMEHRITRLDSTLQEALRFPH